MKTERQKFAAAQAAYDNMLPEYDEGRDLAIDHFAELLDSGDEDTATEMAAYLYGEGQLCDITRALLLVPYVQRAGLLESMPQPLADALKALLQRVDEAHIEFVDYRIEEARRASDDY